MEQRLLFVFHLDSLSGTTFTNAANSAANGTAVNLNNGRLETGKLGISVELNNNQVITFVNPIASSGPSTFSAWVSQQPTNDNDSLIQLGDGNASRASFFYTRYNSNNLGSGLYQNDWTTGTNIQNAGLRLLHWTYANQVGRLYVRGMAASATRSPATIASAPSKKHKLRSSNLTTTS